MKKTILLILALSTGCMAGGYARSIWPPAPQPNIVGDRDLASTREKICVLGDTGQPGPVLNSVVQAVVQEKCSQIRLLGDLVYPHGIDDDDEHAVEEYSLKPFKAVLGHVPIYLIQGNHDFREGHGDSWLSIAKRLDGVFYPYFYYSERWGRVCFFSLETTFDNKLYYPLKRLQQRRWLANSYSDYAEQCGFSVVYTHHPFRSSGDHGPAEPRLNQLLGKWVTGRVDLQVSGHEHILSDEGRVNGTRLSVVGSSSKVGAVRKQSWDAPFSASTPGFITLSFYSVGGDIFCKVKLISVELDAGGELQIRDVWRQEIKGRGIRS